MAPTEFFEPEKVQQWAVATTTKWSSEVRAELQREKHCKRTASYRVRKQGMQAAMAEQRRHLEDELKKRLASVEAHIAQQEDPGDDANPMRTIQRLVFERKLLVAENSELREAVRKHTNFQRMMQRESCQIFGESKCSNNEGRIRDSRWMPAPPTTDQSEKGWRVHFVNGMPSFYFHPFTRNEYDAVLKRCDNTLAFDPPRIEVAGSLFGWTVHHAPLTRRADNSFVAHARYTRRVHCSLDDADKVELNLDIDGWPLVFTPPSWEFRHREQTCSQLLQEFDTDAYVLVHDIPGPTHFRYIDFARRLIIKQPDGRRMATYVMVIADSEANARGRAAEQAEFYTHWVREGGSYIKFTEIDETTIDVSYDRWSSCLDELHAENLFVGWAQHAVRFQQLLRPSHLLTS